MGKLQKNAFLPGILKHEMSLRVKYDKSSATNIINVVAIDIVCGLSRENKFVQLIFLNEKSVGILHEYKQLAEKLERYIDYDALDVGESVIVTTEITSAQNIELEFSLKCVKPLLARKKIMIKLHWLEFELKPFYEFLREVIAEAKDWEIYCRDKMPRVI